MTLTRFRTPGPDQAGLWGDADQADPLYAPDAHTVTDPAGMEQPSMFAPVTDPPPFEACDECGLDINDLHHDDCGDCYCDGAPCLYEEPEE